MKGSRVAGLERAAEALDEAGHDRNEAPREADPYRRRGGPFGDVARHTDRDPLVPTVGWGQRIREDGPHLEKMGTPTMGGTVIIAGIVAGYVATRIVFTTVTAAGISVLLATVLLGLLGFMDDFIKVRRRRSLGLSKTAKIAGQAVIALIFGMVAVRAAGVPTERPSSVPPASSSGSCSTCGVPDPRGLSNAVNLTDGLDGSPRVRRSSCSPRSSSSRSGSSGTRAR